MGIQQWMNAEAMNELMDGWLHKWMNEWIQTKIGTTILKSLTRLQIELIVP